MCYHIDCRANKIIFHHCQNFAVSPCTLCLKNLSRSKQLLHFVKNILVSCLSQPYYLKIILTFSPSWKWLVLSINKIINHLQIQMKLWKSKTLLDASPVYLGVFPVKQQKKTYFSLTQVWSNSNKGEWNQWQSFINDFGNLQRFRRRDSW